MTNRDVQFRAYRDGDLDRVLRLTQRVKWPHRREDLSFVSLFSDGVVVESGGDLVGSAFCVSMGSDAAALCMIIVDEAWRGRGLGRKLVAACVAMAGPKRTHLMATMEGAPLYEKFGFEARGEVAQHQGVVTPDMAGTGTLDRIRWSNDNDLTRIQQLDRTAVHVDRSDIMRELARIGRFAVLQDDSGQVEGFAGLRGFGRGHVVGPVVAGSAAHARELFTFMLSEREGSFCRIDIDVEFGLGGWFESRGLPRVDTVLPMFLNTEPAPPISGYLPFALINHAFG